MESKKLDQHTQMLKALFDMPLPQVMPGPPVKFGADPAAPGTQSFSVVSEPIAHRAIRPEKVRLLKSRTATGFPDYFGKEVRVSLPFGAIGTWNPHAIVFAFPEHKRKNWTPWVTWNDLLKEQGTWEPVIDTDRMGLRPNHRCDDSNGASHDGSFMHGSFNP